MKTFFKVIAALAAIAGAVYVVATYGDKIVAWAKKLLGQCPCCCEEDCDDCPCEDDCDDCPCECTCGCDCECVVEEAEEEEAAEEAAVNADEADFEG